MLKKVEKILREAKGLRNFSGLDDSILPYALWSANDAGGVTVVAPNGKMAEELAEALTMIGKAFGEERKAVVVPEKPRGTVFTLEEESAFMVALCRVAEEKPAYVLIPATLAADEVPTREAVLKSRLTIAMDGKTTHSGLLKRLVEMDYDDEFEVTAPGEFSRRGGIIDVFGVGEEYPVRLDFWGEELEQMRSFSPETQRSTGEVTSYRVMARQATAGKRRVNALKFAGGESGRTIVIHPEACARQVAAFAGEEALEAWQKCLKKAPNLEKWEENGNSDFGCFPAVSHLVRLLPEEIMESSLELIREQIAAQVKQWLETGFEVILGGADETSLGHIARWLEVFGLDKAKGVRVEKTALPTGVMFPAIKTVFLNEKELFAVNLKSNAAAQSRNNFTPPEEAPEPRSPRLLDPAPTDIVADLNEGDMAVHLNFGIGIFRGIRTLAGRGTRREVIVLEYADEKLVYVPPYQAHLVSRYMGSAGKAPLSRLNSKKWSRDRQGAAGIVHSYAADLLRMQAVRKAIEKLPLPPEDYEQLAFENGCGFELTRDQRRAIAEIKSDMSGAHPMDRLLCGDVGFGKTEVAFAAAFRMVYAGYQVAVLAATTVLAQQHFYNFSRRFAEYGVRIEMVSRFRTAAEQRKILEQVKSGGVDIVIGTHRLCQPDVEFANLGLVVIDEEQRFGVKHKEHLRRLRASANVLSMSATPIPRTLYLAMAGARDLSTIMTAPRQRLPVKTVICAQRELAWVETVRQELARGGQVYYLHNRVKSIEECAATLRELFPEARISTAHGQMEEEALEETMAAFLEGKIDILVCTSIVESGLDIPNANTIVIERADRFGLADLYQLRGRVGRSTRQGYACMLLPASDLMTLDGRKRIAAIRRYSHLGAGFQLALRDLEIRGAGNLLGEEQSGCVRAIGFDLYCKLLTGEIKRLKGEKVEFLPEVEFAIDFLIFGWEAPDNMLGASLPPSYIESEQLRMEAYRKLAAATGTDQLNSLRDEFRDRFGAPPKVTENLFVLNRIRILMARKNYVSLSVGDGMAIFRTSSGIPFRIDGKAPRLSPDLPPGRKLVRLLELAKLL